MARNQTRNGLVPLWSEVFSWYINDIVHLHRINAVLWQQLKPVPIPIYYPQFLTPSTPPPEYTSLPSSSITAASSSTSSYNLDTNIWTVINYASSKDIKNDNTLIEGVATTDVYQNHSNHQRLIYDFSDDVDDQGDVRNHYSNAIVVVNDASNNETMSNECIAINMDNYHNYVKEINSNSNSYNLSNFTNNQTINNSLTVTETVSLKRTEATDQTTMYI